MKCKEIMNDKTLNNIQKDLESLINKKKGPVLQKFFKTGPGEYGEGDIFLGVSVPDQRKIAKKYKDIVTIDEINYLLDSEIHEHRLTALFLLIHLYNKSKDKKEIVNFYTSKLNRINNWDLVDSSAHHILGHYLNDKKDRSLLYDLAKSNHLWKERVAIISTMFFIKKGSFADTLKISEILLEHEHDLIHKAVGWMLREVGKKDLEVEIKFLKKYYKKMPRTMLRYAIEKFDENLRKKFLNGEI